MSEMIERVARAIFKGKWQDGFGSDGLDPDELSPKGIPLWKQYEEDARSAISAMRVPTEAMEDAANALDDWGVPSDPGSGNACALAHWEAMINEALK